MANRLLAIFVVADKTGFHAHKLKKPDSRTVSPSKVKYRVYRLCGVVVDLCYPSVQFRYLHLVGKDSAIYCEAA